VGSLDAIRTTVEKRARGGAQIIELTWIGYQGQIYQVTGVMRKQRASEYLPLVRACAESFRPLTSAQRRAITQERLRIARAREDESLAALAERKGTAWEPERVAVANALEAGATLDAGALVKVSITEPY
jgi:predicted Zn-dependent protease